MVWHVTGGGALSGKDPSKVDRSAAYAGRYVCKNIVAAGLADKCEIQVSYAIGVAEPTSISINTFNTAKVSEELIIALVREHFDLRPYGITRMFDLIQPMYKQTAAYGHFGREGSDTAFTWEKTDKVEALKASAGSISSFYKKTRFMRVFFIFTDGKIAHQFSREVIEPHYWVCCHD